MLLQDSEIGVILADGRRFMVPLYQRKFQWHDSQIIPFWDDVAAKAAEQLEGEAVRFQHYMGALILAPIATKIGVTPKVQVVDGQQRLTTFQLFLSAFREVARKHGFEDVAIQVHAYLFNNRLPNDADELAQFKLDPTPSDRELFHHIVKGNHDAVRNRYQRYYRGERVPKNTELRALRAYEEFYRRIDQFAEFGPDMDMVEEDENALTDHNMENDVTDSEALSRKRLVAILEALLSRMKLVVISLGEDDDAQVIFETLNSKGEPLLAMDLVRNNIFHRAEKNNDGDIERLYRELWDPFDHYWWREYAPFARPKRPRIDHFLTHVLAAETGNNISMRELYAEYKHFAVPNRAPRFDNITDELQLLQKYSPLYQILEGSTNENLTDVDEELRWLGRKLAAWQVTTAYPVAMQISANVTSKEEREKLYLLIYSYIVRRALSGLTSKNLNRVFQSLSQRFKNSGSSLESFSNFFSDRSGDSTRFPNDGEFREGILTKRAYSLAPQTRIKDVLWELEKASRTVHTENMTMPSGLWTEHVLPVTWTENWPFEDGIFVKRDSGDSKAEKRNELLHSIGNLTLLTRGLNISSSNKPFLEKREKLIEHTTLCMNRWFQERDCWYESKIIERSKYLANKAVRIWPALTSPN